MKERRTTMPFFVEDYLGSIDVRLMMLTERGAYVHLRRLNWQEGRLPTARKKLARRLDCSLQEFQQIWKEIRHQFKEDAQGRIYNQQAEAIKRLHLERRWKLALAGREGGRADRALADGA